MLTLENLTLRYKKKTVLDRVSFDFSEGCTTGVVGASGIGKSTLLHAIAGLKKCDGGKILSSHERISYIFQEPRLFPWMTALENITVVGAEKSLAEHYLHALFEDADEVAKKYPHELSGGMKQRISVARALAYAPDLLLLDEPFRGLDAETKTVVQRLIFNEMQGKTMLLVTHDDDDLAFCEEIVRMQGSPVSEILLEKSGSRKNE
ncbi:MAG: ATP-binding cassette domain-containing protein [Clostridia bacterium]|nr:ATP-binding cassette domain-containing protein [Clostridia bacterium]